MRVGDGRRPGGRDPRSEQFRGSPRRRARRPAALGALALSVALLAGGCASDDDGAAPDAPSTTVPSTTAPTTGGAAPAFGEAASAIEWFVGVLNGNPLSAEQYEVIFSDEFRRDVPYEAAFRPLLDQLQAAGPYTVLEPVGPGPQGQAIVTDAAGASLVVSAAVADGVIGALVVQDAAPPTLDDPPESIEEALDRLGTLGTTRALVAQVGGGACTPVHAVAADEAAPIGSVFKLYVLAALGEEIAAGTTAWDDQLVIRDELKSLPTGVLQDRPDGEQVSVRQAAELMISISDNTATDLLIHHLGRERVEQAMADRGVDPAGNVPLLTTRELFILKLGPQERRQAYLAAGIEERRDLLEQLPSIDRAQLDATAFTQPVAVEQLEWFASPERLCDLAIDLAELAGRDGLQPIDEILSANPGVPPAGAEPSSLWFKGGSEPGLLAAWWRAVSGDRTIVVTGSVVDPSAPIDELEAMLLLAAARDLAIGGSP